MRTMNDMFTVTKNCNRMRDDRFDVVVQSTLNRLLYDVDQNIYIIIKRREYERTWKKKHIVVTDVTEKINPFFFYISWSKVRHNQPVVLYANISLFISRVVMISHELARTLNLPTSF